MCTLRGHKGAYPTPFEAVLRAEGTLFSELQACRTLQAPRLIWTVHTDALFLRWWDLCFRHDGGPEVVVLIRSFSNTVLTIRLKAEQVCPVLLVQRAQGNRGVGDRFYAKPL
jgi:hypothetical protein